MEFWGVLFLLLLAVLYFVVKYIYKFTIKVIAPTIGWILYNFTAGVDRLLGHWGNSPVISWAVSGLVIGSILYFCVREASKLSRPTVRTALLLFSVLILAAAPYIGPKTGNRPTVTSIDGISDYYTGRWEGRIQWNGQHPADKAVFTIRKASSGVLTGDVVYGNEREYLRGYYGFYGSVRLTGTAYANFSETRTAHLSYRKLSLDTFKGTLSGDKTTLTGTCSAEGGNKGVWTVRKVNALKDSRK